MPFHSKTTMLQLRKTIRKANSFIHKSLQNFRSFFSGGYQKLPRSLSFDQFLCKIGNARSYTNDKLYNEFYDITQSSEMNMYGSNKNNISKSKDLEMEDDATSNGSFMCFAKQSPQKGTHHEVTKEKKNKGSSQLRKREDLSPQNMNKGGAHVLAQKMKELDMMDGGDLEHVLDIEEALYYYSRLTSPVYLDIVDKFFMDIYSEFCVPQPSSVNFKHSKQRLGPIQLQRRSFT